MRCAVLIGFLACLAAIPAWGQQSAARSCPAELEAIRDQLRPLVQDVAERAAACAALEGYRDRFEAAERRARGAEQRALAAERQSSEAAVQLREENVLLVRVILGLVERRSQPIAASCDQLNPPAYAAGIIVLSGMVENPMRWRDRALEIERELGVRVRLDLRERRCLRSVARGWGVAQVNGQMDMRASQNIALSELADLPRAEDCPALGREMAEQARSRGDEPLAAFWVVRRATASGDSGGVSICRVPRLPGDPGLTDEPTAGRPVVVVVRD